MNSLLSIDEVKSYLQVEEEDIEGFITKGKLHAYKIGGTYIRFRKEEVLNLRYEVSPGKKKEKSYFFSRIVDFWHFNNFYIVSLALILLIAAFFIKS